MAITDDLIHGTILAWECDTGTPAQQVEIALQGYRNRFNVEPQVVLSDPARTPVRGPNDDPVLVARQGHIEFRDYAVVGKNVLYVAMKFGVEPMLPFQPFYSLETPLPAKKKRTEKQERRHQELVDSGMALAPTVPVVVEFIEEVELTIDDLVPRVVSPVRIGYAQFAKKRC